MQELYNHITDVIVITPAAGGIDGKLRSLLKWNCSIQKFADA